MKNLHYILAVLIFFSMAISVSHDLFIFVAMALYLIQMVLMRGKDGGNKIDGGGGKTVDEPSGTIKDLPNKDTGA